MPFTLSELAATLERNVAKAEALLSAELRVAGKVIQETAKEMIGHEHALWPPLKPATIEDKERKGYDTPAPLLRTGELRDSIETETLGLEMIVGSHDKVAVYQEMGTSRIPPRPFLEPSAIKGMEELHDAIGKTAVAMLTPGVSVDEVSILTRTPTRDVSNIE